MRVEKRKVCMRVFLTIMSWSDEDEDTDAIIDKDSYALAVHCSECT